MDRVAIWSPLALGAGALAATIVIHALAVAGTVKFARHQVRVRGSGAGFWSDVAIVAGAVGFALAAHLLEIGVWAVLLVACGEFPAFAIAYYHSAVNYTTLGYGDIVMSESWRFLGPLEATNGMLLFGVSTALVFAVIQRIAQAKFPDLKA
jgi:hypothetical protein